MNALASTWPWSLPPGPAFLVAYVPLALILVGCGVMLAIVVGNVLDGPLLRASSSATSAAVSSSAPTLIIGRMPRAEHVFLVAWLRGGRDALQTTLFAAARAAGWLTHDGATFGLLPDVVPADRALAQLHRSLATCPTLDRNAVNTSLWRASVELDRWLARLAEEGGLVRPIDRRIALLLVGLGGAGVAVVAGLVRIAVRAQLSPDAVFPRNLVLVMVALVVASAVSTWKLTRRHRQARAYLAWLDDVTEALRVDVRQGHVRRPDDVTLTAALDGERGLGLAGASLGFALLAPTMATASAGDGGSSWSSSSSSSSCSSSSSSSSCASSSSSCSSSGSSCGSSCGGGGGCS